MIAAHSSLTASTRASAGHILDIARFGGVAAALKARALDSLGQAFCGLRGHAMMLHFESTRLSLHCPNCGRTTPGWSLEARGPDARRTAF